MANDLAPYKRYLKELAREKERVLGQLTYLTSEERRTTKEMQKECPHSKVKEGMYYEDDYGLGFTARKCIECEIFEKKYDGYKSLANAPGREVI